MKLRVCSHIDFFSAAWSHGLVDFFHAMISVAIITCSSIIILCLYIFTSCSHDRWKARSNWWILGPSHSQTWESFWKRVEWSSSMVHYRKCYRFLWMCHVIIFFLIYESIYAKHLLYQCKSAAILYYVLDSTDAIVELKIINLCS